MKKMKPMKLLLLFLLPLCLGLSMQEDDLVFDDVGEETPTAAAESEPRQHQQSRDNVSLKEKTTSSTTLPKYAKKWQRNQKLLPIRDSIATVGHVFKFRISKDIFIGNLDYFEAHGLGSKTLPRWLRWDEPANVLSGVPSRKDLARNPISITAYGKNEEVAQGSFTIHVVPENRERYKHGDGKKTCREEQDRTMLTILIDARYDSLNPSTKVNALENLAGFLGLHTSSLSMYPDSEKLYSSSPLSNGGSSVVLSGPGNISRRREKHSTLVQWQVGCDGHFWPHEINTIKLIPEQAMDGTLSEVMQLPVYQWRVWSDSNGYERNRRETTGSGDNFLPDEEEDEYDEEEYDDEDYDTNEGITESPQQPKQKTTGHQTGVVDEHPHRHHHGEDSIAGIGADINNEEDFVWRNEGIDNAIFNSTTASATTPSTPSYTDAFVPSREVPLIVNFTTSQWNDNVTESVPARSFDPVEGIHIPEYNSTNSTTSTTTLSTTISTTPSTPIVPNTTTSESTTMPSSTNTTTKMPESTSTTTTMSTTTTTTTTTMMTTTTTTTAATTKQSQPSTTETLKIEYGVRNFPPKVESRLKKIPITQGKLLSYTIPEDAFSDPEDGNTRQLRLRIYEKGAPLKSTYWLQFNEDTQEVYGLPLEEYYGPFAFEIRAIDSEGLTASNRLDVSVQQHKQIRAMNHEFHLYLKIEKRSEFKTNVDWELKVMRSLAELYGDTDLNYITVRSIDIDRDQAIYTWTNDSLARSSTCPQEEINRLYRVLVHDEKTEDPSEGLIRVLGPEIKPKRVVYQGLEQCQQSKETQINKFPVPRNQIDQLNATVGQLFVYRVPKDTFFDEEDGDTGSMKASLLTANRTEIPQWDWLQFDSNNQEFYGVPLKQDIGRKTYQLIVKDREGLEATDSLVAEVHSAPMLRHVVEISMTLNMPLEAFAHSALKKREFIHKLQRLYGDKNASAISILSINGNHDTTTVIWRNLSLPTQECPSDEITRLRRVLVNDNKSFSDELDREFNSDSHQPDFAVIQITVGSTGACGNVGIGRPEMPPLDDSTSVGATHDDYLITFVLPAIIIVAMLLLAGLIACILYKRRRSGKMSVSEKDDERQSFRSKGIPVIFQDELDEKPDPGNKSPIILKEEKPPLPPPEYQRAEDGADIPMLSKESSEEPYQPPPPFATNRENSRQNRPKPTPTYRKPPPYVPP